MRRRAGVPVDRFAAIKPSMAAWQSAQATEPDLWHVLLGPGETKVLSLEQVDDLFRLDIISAETPVWQPGMTEWLPLSVVAGLDDDEDETIAHEPARAFIPPPHRGAPPLPDRRPPPPHQLRNTAQGLGPQAAQAAQGAFAQSYAQPPMINPATIQPQDPYAATYPAQPYGSAAPRQYPQTDAYGLSMTQSAQFAPSVAPAANPWSAPAESVRPVVMSGRPSYETPRSSGGWGGRFVMTLALLGSLGVTAYRNDWMRPAALSVGREASYLQIERSLGGPGFGTPRAVQTLGSSFGAASLGDAAAPAFTSSTTTERAPTTIPSPPPIAAPVVAAPTSTTTATAAPTTPSESAPTQREPERAAATKATPERARPAAPAERPRPSTNSGSRRTSSDDSPPPSPAFKGSGNKYDPLNGKL